MKKLFQRITCFALIWQTLAAPVALATESDDPTAVLTAIDQYITLRMSQSSPPAPATADGGAKTLANVMKPLARQVQLTNGLSVQIVALTAEDFNNVFLINMMERYIHHPEQRMYLFDILKSVRLLVQTDLAKSALLKQGPVPYISSWVEGTWATLFEVLIAGVLSWKLLLRTPLKNQAIIQEISAREARLREQSTVYRYVTKNAWYAISGSTAGAAGIGYLQYVLANNRTYRLDPADMLSVVQAGLACQLSYDAVSVHDHLIAISTDDNQMEKEGPQLRATIQKHIHEANVLLDQFPWLVNLDIKDRIFQSTIVDIPKSEGWQAFTKMLTVAEQSTAGQCREISLPHVIRGLEGLMEMIPAPESAAATAPAGESIKASGGAP